MTTLYRTQISREGFAFTGVAEVSDILAPTYECTIDGRPGRTFTLPRHLVVLLGIIEDPASPMEETLTRG